MNASRLGPSLPRKESGSRMLSLVIAVMVFLASLSVASFGAISHALEVWRSDLASRITVQIPARPKDSLTRRQDAALGVLRRWRGISAARALSDSELGDLLEPWLGKQAALSALPVPRLIDVDVGPGAQLDTGALAAALAEASPGAVLDDNQDWVRQVVRIANMIRTIAAGAILLIAAAAIAIVIFATRAGLSVHHDSIEILHLMGARDTFVAREFQVRYFRLGLLGGALGLILTTICLFGAFRILEHAQGPWLPRLVPGPPTFVVVAILPFLAGLLAMGTARATVLRSLRRMM